MMKEEVTNSNIISGILYVTIYSGRIGVEYDSYKDNKKHIIFENKQLADFPNIKPVIWPS